jgi:hypothetical protein
MSAIISFIVAVAAFMQPRIEMEQHTYRVASIMRGEVPQYCLDCELITACALLDDIRAGVILSGRWNGWRNARSYDKNIVRLAIWTDVCDRYPKCAFVGNAGKDLATWVGNGWVDSFTGFCGRNGCTVCVHKRETARYVWKYH